jgi:protein TonB
MVSLTLAKQRCLASTGAVLAFIACLQGCSSPPRTSQAAPPSPPPTPPTPVVQMEPPPTPALHISAARNPGEYRQHAAQHLYERHASRLFAGPMPPLLQAVGVLDIEIGPAGEVRSLRWLRAPSHVPEVMRQIEQMIHHAAPYPAPVHLSSVTYTDTWSWHQSGRFQLHTLSEGQLGEINSAESSAPKRRATRRAATVTAKCSQPAATYC